MLKKHEEKIFGSIIFFLLAGYGVLLFKDADVVSIWLDDMVQLSVSLQDNFSDFYAQLIQIDMQPPLFYLFTAVWARVAPFGSGWLKLLNILITMIGIAVCVFIAKRKFGIKAGILTCLVSIACFELIVRVAYTFRPYGLLFLLSAISFGCYIDRKEKGYSKSSGFLFFLSILLLSYTHYFGIAVCGMYFLIDLYGIWRKKISRHILIVYYMCALCYLPWVFTGFRKVAFTMANGFWIAPPSIASFVAIGYKLIGTGILGNALMFSVFAVMLQCVFREKPTTIEEAKGIEYSQICVIVAWGIYGIVWIYSVVINPESSLFLERYFTCTLPFLFIVIGHMASEVITYLEKVMKKSSIIWAVILMLFWSQMSAVINRLDGFPGEANEPYEQIADYLVENADEIDKNTLVYVAMAAICDEAWEYLLTHKNQRQGIPILVSDKLDSSCLEGINKIYVINGHNEIIDDTLDMLREKEYECIEENRDLCLQIWER